MGISCSSSGEPRSCALAEVSLARGLRSPNQQIRLAEMGTEYSAGWLLDVMVRDPALLPPLKCWTVCSGCGRGRITYWGLIQSRAASCKMGAHPPGTIPESSGGHSTFRVTGQIALGIVLTPGFLQFLCHSWLLDSHICFSHLLSTVT